ncbi:MAG: hypothetical protein LBN27_10160 [Prevotellaceae bacterium]|jgi:hypothetical protein|nr:hypothetical protein [Prevotellaceae bacterium]
MTKKVYLALFLAIAGIASANAQMRISGSEEPNQSAVLDLNPDDNVSAGNATLGLALPRVNLRNSSDAFPLSAHVRGMTVYNMATTGDVTPGVYIDNGAKWLRQLDSETTALSAVERDSVIGNEVVDATVSGGLIRSGAGTTVSPYTLGVAQGGITTDKLANGSITINKLANNIFTELGDNLAININNTILVDSIANLVNKNAVTSISGMRGISVSGTTNTPVVGLPAGSNGQVLKWNNGAWAAGTDLVGGTTTGDEIVNATLNGGLVRSGSGAENDPYTLGLLTATANSIMRTDDGGKWGVWQTGNQVAEYEITKPSGVTYATMLPPLQKYPSGLYWCNVKVSTGSADVRLTFPMTYEYIWQSSESHLYGNVPQNGATTSLIDLSFPTFLETTLDTYPMFFLRGLPLEQINIKLKIFRIL